MTPENWSLRLARPADAEFLPAIEQAAAQLFEGHPEAAGIAISETREVAALRRFIATGHCLVAEAVGSIAGFLVNQPFRRELHIWEMDVHPDFQRHGIGAGLVRACLIDARNCGFSAVTLTTFRDIAWNAPFYAGLGFVQIDDLSAHPRMAEIIADETARGIPAEQRCAMIKFLDA